MIRTATTVVLGWTFIGAVAFAHHGLGSFDVRRDIAITGTIAGLDFVNPHSWLYVDGVDEDGTPRRYRCEMRPATALRRAGWTPEMFAVGAPITIEGSPHREDPNACYVATLVFEDGTTLDRYGTRREPAGTRPRTDRRPRLPNGDPDISGDWAEERTTMTDPRGQSGVFLRESQARGLGRGEVPEGRRALIGARNYVPPTLLEMAVFMVRVLYGAETFGALTFGGHDPRTAIDLTDVGKAAVRAGTFAETDRCAAFDLVRHWAWTEGASINQIVQQEDVITIQYGHLGVVRTIHMDLAEHPAGIEPSRTGHSIGRWEDDVLIVDTIGFEPGPLLEPYGHGEQLHLVERFSLDPDTMALMRRVTAEDPEYFTGAWTFTDVVFPSETPFVLDPCEQSSFEGQDPSADAPDDTRE